MSYCEYCDSEKAKEVHVIYHNNWYGFPLEDDNALFGRLILEINQAGLSWETILNKENNFVDAYSRYNITAIANYGDEDIERLLNDAGIIRNKLKVNAAIYNAKQILELQKEFGSFKKWLDTNHPLSREEWTKLFKKTFKFTGGEIVNEFLMSTGYLFGAHVKTCPVFDEVKLEMPKWMEL
ncbi:MAG: DNA-3-methyladenine glycosylase I [Flavobacteriales bacterium]